MSNCSRRERYACVCGEVFYLPQYHVFAHGEHGVSHDVQRTKEVSLDFWSLYLQHYGVDNAINRLVRFTDLIEAGDFDGAVSELKSGIDAELLNY